MCVCALNMIYLGSSCPFKHFLKNRTDIGHLFEPFGEFLLTSNKSSDVEWKLVKKLAEIV